MVEFVELERRGDCDASYEARARGVGAARCSLWWSATPALAGRRVGFIGHYWRSDGSTAMELLHHAERRLAAAGCELAVGPVDGSTWRRYRFITERGTRPAFFLEPDNPDSYPADFRSFGFRALARYISAEETIVPAQTNLGHGDARVERAERRLRERGVCIRSFDPSRYESELDAIYAVARASFAGNLLYSPISRHTLGALYEPLRGRIDPDFVRIAEHDGRAVGFAFALRDPLEVPGEPRLVGKTLARLPEQRYAGLGAVLLEDVRRAARRHGIRRLVHALIRDGNVSLNATRRVATPIRTYALFAKDLI